MPDAIDTGVVPQVAPVEGASRALKVLLTFVLITVGIMGVYFAIPKFIKFKPDLNRAAGQFVMLPHDAVVKSIDSKKAGEVVVLFEMSRPRPEDGVHEVYQRNSYSTPPRLAGSMPSGAPAGKLKIVEANGIQDRIYSYDPKTKLYRYEEKKVR